jgi:hypothetical protein
LFNQNNLTTQCWLKLRCQGDNSMFAAFTIPNF